MKHGKIRRLKKPRVYWVDLISADFTLSKMLGVAFTHSEAQQFRVQQRAFELSQYPHWWLTVVRNSEPLA